MLDIVFSFYYINFMYIKRIDKTNKNSDKVYVQYRLVEAYRTENGPRQRVILNLGTLDLAPELFKQLADRIEDLTTGKTSIFKVDPKVEELSNRYAEIILTKEIICAGKKEEQEPEDFVEININSIVNSQVKTIGCEYVGMETFIKLGLDKKLKELGFTTSEVNLSALSIIGRLVNPRSEHGTRQWAMQLSGIDELMGEDYSKLSNNALYRISDKLVTHKAEIEEYLANEERDIFNLEERIILYDLTNTYIEGKGVGIKKAKYGRSKQKRNDCPLITLGLVIDEKGFPKKSEIFEGGVSESGTLLEMVEKLDSSTVAGKKKTVVMDAGIATEKNLKLLLAKGYDYIAVSRNKPVKEEEIEAEKGIVTVKEELGKKVEIKMLRKANEVILYCKSEAKERKERSMKTLFRERLEKEISNLAASVKKKGGVKRFEKVIERIGRIKEKHKRVAKYYEIEVEEKNGIAEEIKWREKETAKGIKEYNGSYFIKTSRVDLDEQTVWSIYTMLTRVEESFRCMKSELNLRPVWHQKEERAEGHLFITVLAYHLLVSIQNELAKKEITMRWANIRDLLKTQIRVTTTALKRDGQLVINRNTSKATEFNLKIYNALGLKPKPLR